MLDLIDRQALLNNGERIWTVFDRNRIAHAPAVDAVPYEWWERMREELTELHENNTANPDVEGVTRFLLNWMKVVEKE